MSQRKNTKTCQNHRNERGQTLFEIFRQGENEVYIASLARLDTQLTKRTCRKKRLKSIWRRFSRNSRSERSKVQKKLWNLCKRSICSSSGKAKGNERECCKELGGSRAIERWNDSRDTVSNESCSAFLACDMEEVCSESSRKMQDKEETTSEASWTAVTKRKEKEAWRLEPEGEAERPEATVPVNGVEGVLVNPEGEGRHGQVLATMARKDRKGYKANGNVSLLPKNTWDK